ncbi:MULTISPECIES: translation elongation factor 4 [Aliarcobacter]|uniref:translation elongation factor 4 n=1 Tax=Aliarcobacter TaxID=2321111 RepID=UPI0008312D1A|nr:translation elongation factor 4 [Aliarcobacter cryaerophilus]MCT7444802.1 translation elongation factor 4 [Aliarcobacter cryaerophilus]MCT7465856.1 translation elongation factor 4 [Aliarcobacter cryaerophilus]MCT7479585.1 translation elongation factor 4 [Aliarcobacter cryaerophilus]MCT7508423.1 translation elongation factor 4 [Aliarcobacter cryaerophilus]MCT7526475.1 translation elongation factor 4 [Aliarcobacter cryaerophilus]
MQKNIRNFSIIAHIDHGKSTLADRIIQECGGISDREMTSQVMDNMDIEKERGITIKAQSVRLNYTLNGEKYILNLIDTPGHVDFSYEVSRSLASSEGALLIVDSTQGVEAQTIANVYIAMDNDLELLPVVNKIDLPSADPMRVLAEVEEAIGLDCTEHNLISAKTGLGVKDLIESIIKRVPSPNGDENAPTKALIYDSWFDNYLGALALVRVYDGSIKKGQTLRMMNTKVEHQVLSLMYPHPLKREDTLEIKTGEIGIVVLGLKTLDGIAVGDTMTDAKNPTKEIIDGFEPAKPFVFAGLYPIETDKFEDLREALNKLKLNDSSISFEPESSMALGSGFRTGFLGMLHMEVIKERLEREFDLDLIATAPTVIYEVLKRDGEKITIQNPSELPEPNYIETIFEPYVKSTILVPDEFLGNVIKLLNDKRGIQLKMDYIGKRVLLEYDLPMNEIVMDFYDKLKSTTKGYASFDYEPVGFRPGNLKKLDVRVAGDIVDALSIIVPEDKAVSRGREFVKALKELIPRQLFEVAVQASIGSTIIARETVKSMGKNVTAKCYGGDITRKRKLLEKQKEGKKRMKAIGKVNVPQEAFMAVLKI